MGNLVADAMLDKYAGEAEAAYTNSGGLRADIPCSPPLANEPDCTITLGEVFAVLPFGNATVIETLTGAQMRTAFINGFGPSCGNSSGTGRFPQIAGIKVSTTASGTHVAVIDDMWKAAGGRPRDGGRPTATPLRFVTNDFMYTGGDGYTVFLQGTNVAAEGRPAPRRRRRLHHGELPGQPGRRGPDHEAVRRSDSPAGGSAAGPAAPHRRAGREAGPLPSWQCGARPDRTRPHRIRRFTDWSVRAAAPRLARSSSIGRACPSRGVPADEPGYSDETDCPPPPHPGSGCPARGDLRRAGRRPRGRSA